MPAAVVVGKSVPLLEENTTSRDCLANILFEKQFTVTEASSEEALIIAWRDESDPVVFDLVSEGMKYVDLNRAAGLEGATKAQAEEILGLTIKTAIPDMESNFALANHLHPQIRPPFTTKPGEPSIILKATAENMVKPARLHRVQ